MTGLADPTYCEALLGTSDPSEPSSREIFHSHIQNSFMQILREAGDIESEWIMLSVSIADGVALRCGRKVSGASRGGRPLTRWQTMEGMPSS